MRNGNVVRQAIAHLGGRLEDVAVVCRVSAQAVHLWTKRGHVPGARHVVLLARRLQENGTPISIERLAGFSDEILGPNRHMRATR